MIEGLLALNRECESQLWPLTEDELRTLLDIAYFAKLTPDGHAMLIAFDERAPYESPNHHWFRARYPRFVYVDRVAVSERARGAGQARKLYEELMAKARADGDTVTAPKSTASRPATRSPMHFTPRWVSKKSGVRNFRIEAARRCATSPASSDYGVVASRVNVSRVVCVGETCAVFAHVIGLFATRETMNVWSARMVALPLIYAATGARSTDRIPAWRP